MSPVMEKMNAYPKYLFDQILPVLGHRVWEIGIGYGSYTRMLLQREKQILATDVDSECIATLQISLGQSFQIQWLHVNFCDHSSVSQAAVFGADSVICF